MRSAFLATCAAALAFAGCQRQAETPPKPAAEAPPVQTPAPPVNAPTLIATPEGETPTGAAQACTAAGQGTVSLTTNGQPGDAFEIVLMCGQQSIAHCTATVPAGATSATCTDGPHPEVAGAAACILRPQNGNSAAATSPANGCVI